MTERGADKVVVIGAGMGGLASAIRLAAAGLCVTVIDSADAPGGKMRTVPSGAGPIDAGPTVLTLPATFRDLFALAGERLEDHLTLLPQPLLARHWWPDGSSLDLTTDSQQNAAAIHDFAGAQEAAAFLRFDNMAQALFDTFNGPVMQAARPDLAAVARAAARAPRLWPALMPGLSLERLLRQYFRDPRLVQLFGRYATYVGGRPARSPAVLALIWRAEAAGVWAVKGGMHGLAQALEGLAMRLGVAFQYGTMAKRILRQGGRVVGVQTAAGPTLPCTAAIFNGDPAALPLGLLGDAAQKVLPEQATQPRSLSAWVWSLAASPQGADLAHHNVFFTESPASEFGPIGQGRMPDAPTLYICAQDRAGHITPSGPERFEIIVNAPAGHPATPEEYAECHRRTFDRLARFGLTFTPTPQAPALTTPAILAQRFPGSQGAIYGRSPEGVMASFQRPGARTSLPGLYLAGGGVHPGAGVPMAALSGKHAAEAILQDRISASRSTPTAMPGGTSMVSRMTGSARSRS
jgi:1-hydroxycarotenoid 3,4-desaturase